MDRSRIVVALATALTAFSVISGIFIISMQSRSSGFERPGSLAISSGSMGIALIDLRGIIGQKSSSSGQISADEIVRQLDTASHSGNVAAVILQIDSPGGESGAIKNIYNALRELRKKKPVIAVISGMATSGGYYLASACDRIFSYESSAIGFIQAMNLTVPTIRSMEKRDLWITLSDPSRNAVRHISEFGSSRIPGTLLNDAHQQMINDISEGRGQSIKQVRQWADGSIYSGKKAKAEQLIDDIGGTGEAVEAIKLILKTDSDLQLLTTREKRTISILEKEKKRSGSDLCELFSSPVLYLYPGTGQAYHAIKSCIAGAR